MERPDKGIVEEIRHDYLNETRAERICKVDAVRTICYGEERVWQSRTEAMHYFWQGVCASEGSEQDRYLAIYQKMNDGRIVCRDD